MHLRLGLTTSACLCQTRGHTPTQRTPAARAHAHEVFAGQEAHAGSRRPPAPLSARRDKVVLEHVFSSTALLSYVLCWMIGYNLGYVF